MKATRPSTTSTAHPPTAAFRSILCGLDGSRTSVEAARQAALLCAPDGALRLVAVTWETGAGGTAQSTLSRWRADRVLAEARATALDLGVEPVAAEVAGADPAACLLDQSSGCDLIAIGAHGRSRVDGAPLGGTAAALLRRSPVPILIARPTPDDEIGHSVLLAVDGTPSCLAAADVAARVAAAAGGRAAIVSAPEHDDATRRILAGAAERLREITGTDPIVLDESGAAHRAVAAAATTIGASLVVTGSRGLTGPDAAHSVSERIAATAPCSVLVVRGA